MSKTFEALKKAEAEKTTDWQSPARAAVIATEQGALDLPLEVEASALLGYQKIRTWLTNPASQGQGTIQTVMVVACHSGTGNTTTAALLASTLAQGKKSQSRVLIIDGNFRTPSLNFVFNVSNNGGFSETVSNGMLFDVNIQPTNRPNLFVLTSGQVSLVPAEVFEGESIDHLLAQLKQKFNFIIFDAAPALEFPDSYALAPKVDGIILVVESEKTLVVDAQRAKRDLERAGGRILGVVLNRHKDYTPVTLRKFFSSPY
ncbi:MAG: CpsD/CapB family tyrosine-protein kinase [Deltaproteobacteria bacterium]|nr:CpsD/CapB family tyrosine-protein kinase [Deltaproteobacteria bacterium]